MDADVVVVGGGIVGASIAHAITRRSDRQVTVFERQSSIAAETTAKSNAMFRRTGDAAERRLKREGLACYNELLATQQLDHDVDPIYERVDRLETATTPEGAAGLQDRAAEGPGTYLEPAEIIDHALVPELAVDAVTGALWFPDALRLEPRVLAREFAHRASSAGARFETNTAVQDIRVENGAVAGVRTDAGSVDTDTVIAAAGPNNPAVAAMAGIEVPIRHTLGPILDVRPRAPLQHTLANVKHPETGVYYTGRADGTVMIGRAGGPYERAERRSLEKLDEDRVPDTIRETMDETARTVLPGLALDRIDINDEWVGLVSKTPDGAPIIGFTEVEGFGIAAFNSEGIQLAPAAGRILAEQVIDERSPAEYPHVDPGRFA
ncbi:MAG: NAD(P)/FAD-dependent oxidoreductase [Salinirussus sp.]